MLMLQINEGDYVTIGDDIRVYFDLKITKDSVSLGIEAPEDVEIIRGQLHEKMLKSNKRGGRYQCST